MKRIPLLLLNLIIISSIQASVFILPGKGQDLVGQLQYLTAQQGDTLSSIGMTYDVGRDAMQVANPPFDAGQPLPVGVPIVVPSLYLLPSGPRRGIVVNLSEMRLFYYPPGQKIVMTYPLGVGKPGHMTPLGRTYVTHTQKDPAWIPPKSIREYNKKRGIILPKVIRGGPDNPLGRRAIYLSIPQYLIHATNFPQSIGSRGSLGCMRMIEHDIEQLFPHVAKRTQVLIKEEPYFAGWSNGQLYLEIHKPLSENQYKLTKILAPVMKSLLKLSVQHHVVVNWGNVVLAMQTESGIPTVVSDTKASDISVYVQPQLNFYHYNSFTSET